MLPLLVIGCDRNSDSPKATAQPEERIFRLDESGLYEITGGQQSLIVEPPPRTFIFDAAISREGTHLALSVQTAPQPTDAGYDFGVDLYTGREGSAVTPLIVHSRIGESVIRPNWLPGGRDLIVSVLGRDASGAADLRIERVNIDTGARTRLVDNATEPSLSPDANTLAYVAIDQTTAIDTITLRDLTTGHSHPLLPASQVMSMPGNITWSPDGRRIAFAAADPLGLTLPPPGAPLAATHPSLRDVWVVNADGTNLHRLTDLADGALALAWSLDATALYALGDTGFWRIDTTTGAPTLLGPAVLTGRIQVLASK